MKFLLLILLAGAGVWGYLHFHNRTDDPETIDNPTYAEIRVTQTVQGHELQMVLFGAMANEEDCRKRADVVWERTLQCPTCQVEKSTCRAELEPRYARLFDDVPIHSTYLSFHRGERTEREGRMVIYGLTADEGDTWCEAARANVQAKYTGNVTCVAARRD